MKLTYNRWCLLVYINIHRGVYYLYSTAYVQQYSRSEVEGGTMNDCSIRVFNRNKF